MELFYERNKSLVIVRCNGEMFVGEKFLVGMSKGVMTVVTPGMIVAERSISIVKVRNEAGNGGKVYLSLPSEVEPIVLDTKKYGRGKLLSVWKRNFALALGGNISVFESLMNNDVIHVKGDGSVLLFPDGNITYLELTERDVPAVIDRKCLLFWKSEKEVFGGETSIIIEEPTVLTLQPAINEQPLSWLYFKG